MPDVSSSWPPPPNISAVPAPHDAFLTACVLDTSQKRMLTRLRLMRDLHKKQGTDLRQSLAIVNDFCDRHQILLPPRGFAAWGASLFALANCVVSITLVTIQLSLQRSHDAAITRVARVAITQEKLNVSLTLLGFTVTFCCIITFLALRTNKKQRRAAEDARQKLIAQANTQI